MEGREKMKIKYKKVLVFGSGISGIAACHLLLAQGAYVILYDGNEKLSKEELQKEAGENVQVILGAFPESLIPELSLLVLSPGVPTDLPVLEQIREKQIPVWGEVELAYVYGKGDVLAITGTNGKTTTTTLLGEIMKEARDSVFVVGNIGNPYTEAALHMSENSVAVAEMSSFQLESIHTFRPAVSAILNITPDHLNRHHTMQAYIEAKERVAINQTEADFCVLNYEDEVLRDFAGKTAAKVLFFSSARRLEKGAFLENDAIVLRLAENDEEILCRTGELKLLGTHNYENIMAAALMAVAYGVSIELIRKTVLAFQGVEHRIEFVAEKNGVAYYNDSKGTNPDAAIRGIRAMNRPTLLIGGGYDKESTYNEWIDAFDGKVKKLVLLGATREKIAETARKKGFEDYVFADSFEEAVEFCVSHAKPGDAVLLSPACASWGMFKNYEERGDRFKELVRKLPDQDNA